MLPTFNDVVRNYVKINVVVAVQFVLLSLVVVVVVAVLNWICVNYSVAKILKIYTLKR